MVKSAVHIYGRQMVLEALTAVSGLG